MFAPKPFLFIALFLYLCFGASYGLFAQYRFDTWTTDNGLPQNGIRDITQTPDGYLWFTTFDGLVRFDGIRFTVFNKGNTKGIINNRFSKLYSHKDGTLYATTKEDGVLTIYRKGEFSSLTSDQVPGNYIFDIAPDADGEVRFQVEDDERTSKSWYFLRDGKFVFDERVSDSGDEVVLHGKSGVRWTVTATKTIERRDGKEMVYDLKLGKLDFRPFVFEDSRGNLWIGANSVHRLHDGAIESFDKAQGFSSNSFYHSFWEEADGSVWAASGGSSDGIGLIQYKNGRMFVWGNDHGLVNRPIQKVFRDREGTVWLATDKGLSRRRREVVHGYGQKDGIEYSEIYPLLRDRNDNIWIGSTKGLSIFRNGKFETLDLKTKGENLPLDAMWRRDIMLVQSLWEDASGKIWVGLHNGIFIVENGAAQKLEGFEKYQFFAIKGDRFGNVWAATNKGLLLFRDEKLVKRYTMKDGLPNEFMTVIFEDKKGKLWFGGYGGLSLFENEKFTNYTEREGLTGNYVRTIYEDGDGTFWIGTYDEGLSRFKDGVFINYKAENGLYSNGVFAIQEDKRGYFWISSNQGIYRVNRRELNDYADGKIKKINSVGYGKQDGMLSTECNGGRSPASVTDREGRFWFPTQEGVAVVDAQAETQNPLPPPVVIEGVTVEREPIDFDGNIRIEPFQRNIEINFTGISLIKSEQIKFKYKLEGHDEDWIDAGTRRTAYYSYLPPGNYTFHVIAANSEGIWNETGARMEMDMKPFFYQTKLFVLLCVAVAALLLLIVWRISVQQLAARERKLTKLVAERTAELKKANRELEQLANSDGLTKISNRRRFDKFFTDEWHRAVRFKTEISLVLIDIDYFKPYNDTYGHQAGDECLKKVAAALKKTIHRPTDLLARFGGEEFALILGGTTAEGALKIAKQAVESVEKLAIPHSQSETGDYLTISVGAATIFANLETTESELIKAADDALYRAKANGRNQISLKDLTIDLKEFSILDEEFVVAN